MATKPKKAVAVALPTDANEKKKALDTAISQITKQFGAGSIIKLGENPAINRDGGLDRLADSRPCARNRRSAEGQNHRDIRSRVVR